jgi:hypothetical protein
MTHFSDYGSEQNMKRPKCAIPHGPPDTTRKFLQQSRVTNNPVGDLIGDMRTDPDLPPDFQTFSQLRDYIRSKSQDNGLVMAAVPGVWRRYQRWQRSQGHFR